MLKFGSAWRVLALIVGAVGAGAATFISIYRSDVGSRYFMPGELGRERVSIFIDDRSEQHTNISNVGFLTRSIGLRAGEEQGWGHHNGLTTALPFSHHLADVIPRELYPQHPEFFPYVDGGRLRPPPGAAHWNPDLGREDVARHAASEAAAAFAAHPDAVSFSLGINDALVFGESPETLALTGVRPIANDGVPSFQHFSVSASQRFASLTWFRGRPDYSRLVFTFMNRAAAELAKTHPDKYLGCLAYYWAENVPPFSVDPHVIPFLTADRAQSYDRTFEREEFELQEKWAGALRARKAETLKIEKLKFESIGTEVGRGELSRFTPDAASQYFSRSAFPIVSVSHDAASQHVSMSAFQSGAPPPRLGLYDYLDGLGFLVPRVPIHAFAEHIKHAHAVGFTDYYGESSRNWGLDGPLPWVIAQLLQHPDHDVDALLDEYYASYFQSAAEPMRRFFERCEQQWMRQSGQAYWLKYYRSQSQADLFPPEVCRELRAQLNEAQQVLTTKNTKGHEGSNWFLQEGTEGAENGQETGARRQEATDPKQQNERTQDQRRGTKDEGLGSAPMGWKLAFQQSSPPFSPLSSLAPVQIDLIRHRIRFVSDSFGVTERFVAFQAARANLASKTLRDQATATDLEQYLQRRSEFIRYAHDITAKWPLAFYPINYDDWLRDDPAFAAARQIAGESLKLGHADMLKSEERGSVADRSLSASQNFSASAFPSASISAFQPFSVSAFLAAGYATAAISGHDILSSGDLGGPLQRGRRIAGLQYGIDLPAPWKSQVEPTEHGVAVVEMLTSGQTDMLNSKPERKSTSPESAEGAEGQAGDRRQGIGANSRAADGSFQSVSVSDFQRFGAPASQRFVHFSGQETATMYQWLRAKPGALYAASVQTRGRVTSSDAVTLTLGWLDAQQKPIGKPIVMRLPDGNWPDWVSLRQGGYAPANATWVGIGVRVQHQIASENDFADFARFKLVEFEPRNADTLKN